MSKSNVGSLADMDPFNSHTGSPDIEEELDTWVLEGKLVDTSLIVAVNHVFFGS